MVKSLGRRLYEWADEIGEHWTRQWKEINRNGESVGFNQRQNGSLEVEVHQKVKTYKATLCLMEE